MPSHLNFQEHHRALRNVLAGQMSGVSGFIYSTPENINYQVKLSKILFGLEPPR